MLQCLHGYCISKDAFEKDTFGSWALVSKS